MRRSKWFVVLVMAAVLAFSAALPVSAGSTVVEPLHLDDCSLPAHWAAPYACDLKHQAIMQGDEQGFRLDSTLTRAEFVTLLVRSLNRSAETGTTYADLEAHWANGFVKAAVTLGILTPDLTQNFRPDEAITRQDAFLFLALAVGGTAVATADLRVLDSFPDAKLIAPEARQAMAYALLSGVVQGHDSGLLAPQGNLTRGEAAKIISVAVPEIIPSTQEKLSLVLFNDLHGRLFQDGKKRVDMEVGIERLTTAIAGQMLKNPNTLIIDGGDTFQGTPISNLVSGQSTAEWRNKVGVQVAALGNHEFDWTVPTLQNLITTATHRVLSSNIFLEGTDTRPDWAKPSTTLTVGGYKVGVISVITPVTKSIVTAENIAGLEFRDPAPVVNAEAKKLREAGADLVIVVSHTAASPGKTDEFKVENEVADWMKHVTERIDAVTGAHSHEMVAGYVVNAGGDRVPVIQAGSYGKALARIDLYIDKATKTVAKAVPVVWEPSQQLAATPWTTDLLTKWNAQVKPIQSQPVGKIGPKLTRTTTDAGESALGDFIADAMLTAGQGTQIALMNGGGIRADLEGTDGNVTWGDLYTIQPFGNTLVTVEMTGAELKTLLEQGVDSYVKRILNQTGAHAPMQVAGITFTWDFAKPMGERVDGATLKMAEGTAVDMAKTYKVVVNNFMAGGGDDLAILKTLTTKQVDLGVVDLDVCVAYFKQVAGQNPLAYSLQNRIQVRNFPAKGQ
jgi:2',3'-cyclic-nucleotide 2'-phosphodiesterase (5'-nucleotidase family)